MAFERLTAHIRKQGYEIVETEPDSATRMRYPKLARVTWVDRGYSASRTSMDLPISQLVLRTADAGICPEEPIPNGEHGAVIAVRLAEHDRVVDAVDVDRDQHRLQPALQLLGQPDIPVLHAGRAENR